MMHLKPSLCFSINEYDKAGRTKKVKDSETATPTVYDYYYNGSTKNITYPSGSKEEYDYYSDNLLKTLTNTANGVELDKYEYQYDGAHNQAQKTEKIKSVDYGTIVYVYDGLNRLEKVTEPSQLGGKVTDYTYDNEGNRDTEEVTQNSTQLYKTVYNYNEQNRLTDTATTKGTVAENVIYAYDNNGNMFSENKQIIKPATEQDVPTTSISIAGEGGASNEVEISFYTYDVFNKLITIQKGGETITNTYNGDGLRVSKIADGKTSIYLYEYNKVVLELDGSGNQLARNVIGTNLISRTANTETLFYLYNGHADVTALLDNSGTVVASYYYDAFGTPVQAMTNEGSKDNPFRYAGYEYDTETGLYYLKARFYNSSIARFMQEDTYRGTANDPLSLNLYVYCVNNPLIYWDYTGHAPKNREIVYQLPDANAGQRSGKLDGITVNGTNLFPFRGLMTIIRGQIQNGAITVSGNTATTYIWHSDEAGTVLTYEISYNINQKNGTFFNAQVKSLADGSIKSPLKLYFDNDKAYVHLPKMGAVMGANYNAPSNAVGNTYTFSKNSNDYLLGGNDAQIAKSPGVSVAIANGFQTLDDVGTAIEMGNGIPDNLPYKAGFVDNVAGGAMMIVGKGGKAVVKAVTKGDDVVEGVLKTIPEVADSQLGKKLVDHAVDYGLTKSKEGAVAYKQITQDVLQNATAVKTGSWKTLGECEFWIKGNDVAIVKDGKWVSTFPLNKPGTVDYIKSLSIKK